MRVSSPRKQVIKTGIKTGVIKQANKPRARGREKAVDNFACLLVFFIKKRFFLDGGTIIIPFPYPALDSAAVPVGTGLDYEESY